MHVDITFTKRCFFSKDFSLKVGTSRSILLDEKYFWISFHDDIALLIKASLPYLLIFTLRTFENPFKEQDVSYLWESEEKVNQLLRIHGRSKLIDLLKKSQFSTMVLSCKLTISFMPTEKRV